MKQVIIALASTTILALGACQGAGGNNQPEADANQGAAANQTGDAAPEAPAAATAPLAGMRRLGGARIQGWVNAALTWPDARNIPVCWEQPGATAEKAWVRDAIAQSWEANSSVRFTGWGQCTAGSRGIRIRVVDAGAFTQGLGKALNGVPGGMQLNFVMLAWNAGCVQQSGREACVRMVAIHEFGHALGFAHEQNRPDTPGECDERQGSNGTRILTPWDAQSVMNYCNPVYSNGGRLSAGDISSVQQVYGADM